MRTAIHLLGYSDHLGTQCDQKRPLREVSAGAGSSLHLVSGSAHTSPRAPLQNKNQNPRVCSQGEGRGMLTVSKGAREPGGLVPECPLSQDPTGPCNGLVCIPPKILMMML